MAESFRLFISGLDPISLVILVFGIFGVLILLPKALTEAGIKKLGPIQLEQENQTLNHITQRQIESIDTQNRENLWEMTEDLVFDKLFESKISCNMAAAAVTHALITPLRNMILLNHVAPKLAINEETSLKERITRSINRTRREIDAQLLPNACPATESIQTLNIDNNGNFIDGWLKNSREITAKSCLEKLKTYNAALNQTKDRHWKDIFTNCYNKNVDYIEAMGFIVNKQMQLEAK